MRIVCRSGGYMPNGLRWDGVLSPEELRSCPGVPGDERLERGAGAIIECFQEIPCNPCEIACPHGAIKVGEPITRLPVLDEEKCIGCGTCIPSCPGMAIFVVNKNFSKEEASVSIPYEFLPLPEVGQEVKALDRYGREVTKGRVVQVLAEESFDHTSVITIAIPKGFFQQVRGIAI